MATHGRGLICLCLTPERCDELGLRADDRHERDAVRHRVHRLDRGPRRRLHRDLGPRPRAHDPGRDRPARRARATSSSPGHVFPLRARAGGVLQRSGQTEASVDLARLAGLVPAGVVCEIMNDDGTMARVPDLDAATASATG